MRVLLVDIETSPNIGYCWGKWQQNIIRFVKESEMLCFVAKWLEEPAIFEGRKNRSSSGAMVRQLWKLLDEADVVIAHNGDRFDIPRINGEFLKRGIMPPSPYKTVDTKKVAKQYFSFGSNKLDDIGQYLKLGKKLDTGGFDLWIRCMAHDESAWEKMLEYNRQDVVLLEKIYLKLRPWIKDHPNFNHFVKDCMSACPKCGSFSSVSRGRIYLSNGERQRRRCKNCGGNFAVTLNKQGVERKPTLNA